MNSIEESKKPSLLCQDCAAVKSLMSDICSAFLRDEHRRFTYSTREARLVVESGEDKGWVICLVRGRAVYGLQSALSKLDELASKANCISLEGKRLQIVRDFARTRKEVLDTLISTCGKNGGGIVWQGNGAWNEGESYGFGCADAVDNWSLGFGKDVVDAFMTVFGSGESCLSCESRKAIPAV